MYPLIRQYSNLRKFAGTFPDFSFPRPLLNTSAEGDRSGEAFRLGAVRLVVLVFLDKLERTEPEGMAWGGRDHERVGDRVFVVVVAHMTEISDWNGRWSGVCQDGDALRERTDRDEVQVCIDAPKVMHVDVADLLRSTEQNIDQNLDRSADGCGDEMGCAYHICTVNFSRQAVVSLEIGRVVPLY